MGSDSADVWRSARARSARGGGEGGGSHVVGVVVVFASLGRPFVVGNVENDVGVFCFASC